MACAISLRMSAMIDRQCGGNGSLATVTPRSVGPRGGSGADQGARSMIEMSARAPGRAQWIERTVPVRQYV